MRKPTLVLAVLALLAGAALARAQGADALPSWNDTPAKKRIQDFVAAVTDKNGPDFVPPEQRVATFDNDGTLWTEQPLYVEFVFSLDRVRAAARQRPELREREPFRSVLALDPAKPPRLPAEAMSQAVAMSHAGMTNEDFGRAARDWLATARHPRFKRPYTELTYLPMVELLAYLRANGFATYIVSGGGVDSMRTFADKAYGIPPERVIGTNIRMRFELRPNGPVLMRLPDFVFTDNFGGKPVGIEQHIGRRPIAAFGNSDGDQQMLEWTAAGKGKQFMMLVHHDDAEREYAYDRTSDVGRLDLALDEARQRDWLVTSMKKDWKYVYAFEKK